MGTTPDAVSSCIGAWISSSLSTSSIGKGVETIDWSVRASVGCETANVSGASVVVVTIRVLATRTVVGDNTSSTCCIANVGLAKRSSRRWFASINGVGVSKWILVGHSLRIRDEGSVEDLASLRGGIAIVDKTKT